MLKHVLYYCYEELQLMITRNLHLLYQTYLRAAILPDETGDPVLVMRK
jgi:hypothetical protein